MAVTAMKTLFANQIWENLNNITHDTTPNRAFLVDDDGEIKKTQAEYITPDEVNLATVRSESTQADGSIKQNLTITATQSFSQAVSYKRLYIVNAGGDTLIAYDFTPVVGITEFGESFLITLSDIDELVA